MEAMEPGVRNMKKNLAVRAGAIIMALMVVFFSIIPDLVNAEGDKEEATTEVAVETPKEGEEDGSPQEPQEPGSETTDETTPGENTETGVQPTETPETETPDVKEPETETPGTDAPEAWEPVTPETPETEEDTTPQEPQQPETEVTTPVEGTETDGTKDETVTKPPKEDPSDSDVSSEEKAEETKTDFVIEGTTVTAYNGAGGNVAIPAGITAIGDGVFSGNGSIVNVSFPDTLQIIGSNAFNGCSALEAVTIPGSVTIVGSAAFANCTGLSSVSMSGAAGAVSQRQFFNCSSLTSVTVPDGVSSIGAEAFASCANLNSISLPSTLASLDMSAFSGDANLSSISVNSGSYSSYDGCVYTADGRHLLLCPQGKSSISFAPGIISVASGAFSGCNYLLSAVIPNVANVIEANAFSGSSIRAITIPASVTSIGSQAGWTPGVVYGYSGTTAESWANENNYIFESLDGTSGGVEEQPEHIEDPDPTDVDDPGGTSGTTSGTGGQSGTTGSNSGTNTSTVYEAAPGSAGGTNAAISSNSNGRVKDATPKTGVEEYGIYFLFGAVFLAGIALLAYSRKLRIDGNR